MKIVPFPQSEGPPDEQTLAEIEAALRGDAVGTSADGWRELRADVRTLAPAMSPEFEQQLRERIEARAAGPSRRLPSLSIRSAPTRFRDWLGSGVRARALALGGICAMAAIVTLAIAAPWNGTERIGEEIFKNNSVRVKAGSVHSFEGSARQQDAPLKSPLSAPATPVEQTAPESSSAEAQAPAAGDESSSSRIQQRAASLTLAPKPDSVQSVADQVAQLTVREGGFVQSSQVHRQFGAGGSAELRLSLPSARLSAVLASLGRLAPTREESQSLQDITDEYGAARRKLADAVAERQALLRALARASTQSQIESLHARIALAAGAVTRARTTFGAISRRGSNSTVEVTVLGDAHAGSEHSTLGNGLHDALDVLKTVAVVLLIAFAVLVPLALVLALLALAWRASRRRLRERALS
jgi:Domain of unknown function (DUF4349)